MSLLSRLPDSWKDAIRRRACIVTPDDRLSNLRRAGFAPRRIFDGGAYVGNWTRTAHRLFPEAELLLVEPQPALAPGLEALCRSLPAARMRSVLLGRERGEATLLLEGTNSRIAAGTSGTGSPTVRVPVETIESVLKEAHFDPCDLLKLDLQGHEMEALAGAGSFFGAVEVLLIEVSLLQIGEVPLAHEVVAACTARGYRLYDVFGFNYRPRDWALWQADFIFVRRDSPLISSRQWD